MEINLKEYLASTSKFVNIKDGESHEGVYEKTERVEKVYMGKKSDAFRYIIDGKFLDSTSIKLAYQMANIQKGDKIKISRTGRGSETVYIVEKTK